MEGNDTREDLAEKKAHLLKLQQDLNDIRQGLITIQDFSETLADLSRKKDPENPSSVALPTLEESGEFESLWHFLNDNGYLDDGRIPPSSDLLYTEYRGFCHDRGIDPVEREAFDFVILMHVHPEEIP